LPRGPRFFSSSETAWACFSKWPIYRLHDGIAKAVADADREVSDGGQRIGENDTWIAGFCLYYREPIISLDARAFDRVPRLRRLAY
jgi:predicted nucleic acid-binding protein